MQQILIAFRATAVTLVLTGLAYPALVTAVAQLLFPTQAMGSLVVDDHGQVQGSSLIGQAFGKPAYFQPRPSAAGAGYDASASGGSNLGPTSQKLRDRVNSDLARLRAENSQQGEPVPAELLATSASGLDPHISPQTAHWQLPRIAAARKVSVERVKAVLEAHIEGRTWGFLGEPRVNVLLLNAALDRQFGAP